MASFESRLSDEQRHNLEQARKMLGLRSRVQVLFWFSDNAVEIVKHHVEPSKATGLWYIEQGRPQDGTKK